MNNISLRESLLVQAEVAFTVITTHIDGLLDAAQFFSDRYPIVTPSDRVKSGELLCAVKDLGSLPKSLAAEIERWKKDEERVLSKLGVEIQLLNELYLTMEAAMLFFLRENIDLPSFSLKDVKQSYFELLRCNRLL